MLFFKDKQVDEKNIYIMENFNNSYKELKQALEEARKDKNKLIAYCKKESVFCRVFNISDEQMNEYKKEWLISLNVPESEHASYLKNN